MAVDLGKPKVRARCAHELILLDEGVQRPCIHERIYNKRIAECGDYQPSNVLSEEKTGKVEGETCKKNFDYFFVYEYTLKREEKR